MNRCESQATKDKTLAQKNPTNPQQDALLLDLRDFSRHDLRRNTTFKAPNWRCAAAADIAGGHEEKLYYVPLYWLLGRDLYNDDVLNPYITG